MTNKASTESRWLVVSNLPEAANEETIKKCFERHGDVQSIKINEQHFAFITFWDIRTASKAHYAENILDKQQLKTAFSDGSNSIPKVLLQTSPVTYSIIEPSSSSPSSITTMTNTLLDKAMTTIHEDRDKRTSLRSQYSPEENTRHQVVPIEHNSDSSKSKRKPSSNTNSKTMKGKSTRRKHETSSSSSSSEESHSSSRHHTSKLKRQSPNFNHLKPRILKIYHLPSKMSSQTLRETLRNIFNDFKKSSHLLNIKIIDDYALLTFRTSEDVDKALLFITTKTINGIRLKAEPYDGLITENDEYDLLKRSISSDLDLDEYSVKATRTLYIGNLPAEISYQDLREIYSPYGEIIEIEIKRQQPQHSQIFAFIQYADIKSVVKVLKSKMMHDHLIKLGFGKSQPTNVLWLDNLPLNVTELMLRSFLTRLTNLSVNEILDIYIDNQNAQCLVYFIDTITAQNAINSIRGKKLDTKRIQVDFASRVFLTRFSDIIEQTNKNKSNDRWINQSYRRYSKISDTGSSIARNPTRHHSSSSSSNHSSINHKKLIKSETDKHANTERIFDWLMQHHHSTINDHDEENLKLIETKKDSKEISSQTKKKFQTKIIPLESDSSLIQFDIRLKIYSSRNDQSIKSICLPFPNFAKTLIKSSNNSMILNPKAYLKLSLKDDLFINKELDERIKLLDKQIAISTTTIKSTSSVIQPALISPPLCGDTSNTNSLVKPFERLDSSIKFKYKPIPPPLSVITTLPLSSNNNYSPIYPTPNSALGSQHQSPVTTFSPVSKQPTTVLKSILKPPSHHLSQSTSNETRKAVHIISTKSSLEFTFKPSDDKKKPISPRPIETKKFKLIETIKKPLNIIKKSPIVAKTAPVLSKITTKPPEIKKKPLPMQTEKRLPNNATKFQPFLNKPSVINMKKPEQKLPNQQNKILKKPTNVLPKKKLLLKQTSCMYDRIKERARTEQARNNLLLTKDDTTQPLKRKNAIADSCESEDEKSMKKKKSWVFDSEIFDTGENDEKKVKQPQIITSKFKKKEFILKKKRSPSIDHANQSSKKIKLQSKIQEEQTIKPDVSSINDDQSATIMNTKEEQLDNLIDSKQFEEIPSLSIDTNQQENSNKKQIPDEQNLTDKPTSQFPVDILSKKTLIDTDESRMANTNPSMMTDKLISTSVSDITKSSCLPLSAANEPANLFDSRPISNHRHSSTPLHLFPQMLTPDSNLFTSSHQHFPYPLFAPPPPDSPPLSTRTRSTSSCSSIIGNPLYNSILSGQQHCFDKDSRRESLSKFSTTSSQYIGSDSTGSLRSASELYGYPSNAQQMLNSFASEFYRMNDISSYDPYDIQWEGHIILKTDQAYIKTQLIAGNSQIARITINHWNSDLNHHLHISQRMRLEEIQLDGVKKHMQMDNDYCMLIAEPNGVTPDEIRLEQNHLKTGLIQYLNEKKAAGIINILLPGVLQPVYVAHIFPPCEFASEILQKRAPDAYRCVVQNKAEQIYLLFIITSTIQ